MSKQFQSNESRRQLYRQAGYWGDATLADYWNMAVLSAPEKEAVVDNHGARYTYAELDIAASKVAAFLVDEGIACGDIVSFQIPSWAEFTVIFIACLKVGAIANPILANNRLSEVRYLLNKCESKIFFIPHEFRKFQYTEMMQTLLEEVPSLKKIVVVDKYASHAGDLTLNKILEKFSPVKISPQVSGDDKAVILFTSGTEGHPKGVMLTHNNIISTEKAFNATFNINYLDVILMPAPLAHVSGLFRGVIAPFMVCGKSVLQDVFVPKAALELIEGEKCTCTSCATTFVHDMMEALKKTPYDISSLRFILCAGAPIPKHLVNEAMKVGIKVVPVYGSTESSAHTAIRPDDSIDRITKTDGKPLMGIEVRVVDEHKNQVPPGVEGEEASRGPNVFVGYLNEPELTRKVLDEDGWYYSGDLCVQDADGYIRIIGRKKDLIIRGGENISSLEVENILLQHPYIREAAVVAMPDERLGEKACAYVVLRDPGMSLTLQTVVAFFATREVAKYKFPERVEIVEALPKTASGKVQKFLLRQEVLEKLNKESSTRLV